MEGIEPRNRPGRAGGNRIVVPFDPAQFPHKLDAVLDAGEAFCHRDDVLPGNLTPHRAEGGQIIFDIVDAGDTDLIHRQDGGGAFAVVHVKNAILAEIGAERRLCPAAKLQRHTAHLRHKGGGDLVVGVEHGAAQAPLVQINVALGVDVFLHVLVDVEVVGRDVGDDRHVGGLAHRNHLEAGQLHHRAVLRADLLDARQQRKADVAAQKDVEALRL